MAGEKAGAVRLTKRLVDQAPPQSKPAFLWDSELRGFGMRVEPTGTKSFVLRYRMRHLGPTGPKRFLTIGRYGPLTVEQAREQARAVLGAVSLGRDPAAELARDKAELTFAEAVDLFMAEHVAKKRKRGTAVGYEALLRTHAVPALGARKLSEVSRGDVAKLHSSLGEKPYRANRLIAVIGSLYSFAEKRELVPEHLNPARRIEKYKENRRERFLSTAELQRLGAAIEEGETIGLPWAADPAKPASKHLPEPENRMTVLLPQAAAAIRLLIFTGARLREILHLRWEEVDLQRGLLMLADSKTGRQTIELNGAAQAILAGLPRSGPVVIPGKTTEQPRADLKKPWDLVCARAGLEGMRLHDLRHTLPRSEPAQALAFQSLVSCWHHSQPQTTARYAHLDADPLRRASDLIGETLAAALKGRREQLPDDGKPT